MAGAPQARQRHSCCLSMCASQCCVRVVSLRGHPIGLRAGSRRSLDPEDSFEAHIKDTLDAGGGLCDPDVVRATVNAGPEAIAQLNEWGVNFDTDGNSLHLTREGGHSFRRVVHVADATGKAITQTLTDQVLDNGNIELFNDRVAIDLINLSTLGRHHSRCAGAYVLNRTTGRVEVFQSRFVILATGGASKVYLYTSNPDSSTGDGIAMAWRAGCRVANMEFNPVSPDLPISSPRWVFPDFRGS